MSGGVWLKCDACNKDLRVEADREMQLAVRFKPSIFPVALQPLHPHEHRHRCRSCGWVNVYVPVVSENSLLTPNWRHISLKS